MTRAADFPRDVRDALKALNAFLYLPSEMGTWAKLSQDHKIPFEYGETHRQAVEKDAKKKTYCTYAELEGSMYGRSSIPMLMMAHIIGFKDPRALLYVEELGYALELTRILQNVKRDWETGGRVYLPEDELKGFGLSLDDIVKYQGKEMARRFMGFQVSRARALYLSADEGITLLDERGQMGARLLCARSEAILDKIEVNGYDVAKKSMELTWWERFLIGRRTRRAFMQKSV